MLFFTSFWQIGQFLTPENLKNLSEQAFKATVCRSLITQFYGDHWYLNGEEPIFEAYRYVFV